MMPRNAQLYFLLALAALLPAAAAAQQPGARGGDKQLVAVMELDTIGASKAQASALTERLQEELLRSGKYTVIDRSQINKILEEQALQQSGCTTQECSIQVGKILGVRKLINGRVTKLDERLWQISASVTDVETAETQQTVTVTHEGTVVTLLGPGMTELAGKISGLRTTESPRAAGAGPRPAVSPENQKAAQEWYEKGRALRDRSKGIYTAPEQAIEYLTKAATLNPVKPTYWAALGDAYVDARNLAGALQAATRAIELDPNLAWGHNTRGRVNQRQGNLTEAIADYSKAIQLDPRDMFSWGNRGAVYLQLPNGRAQAYSDYKRACELGRQSICDWLKQHPGP